MFRYLFAPAVAALVTGAALLTPGVATAAPLASADAPVAHSFPAGTSAARHLPAPTAEPYQAISAPVLVPDWGSLPTLHETCAEGYAVDGSVSWLNGVWQPTLTAQGTDIYVTSAYGEDQIGTDLHGAPLYQGLRATLGNHSWTNSHHATITWTCDPL